MFPGETILSGAPSSEVDPHVSELQVMRSATGYYVGTIYTHCGKCEGCLKEDMYAGFQEPNSRETDYFRTRADAESALATFRELDVMPGDRQVEET